MNAALPTKCRKPSAGAIGHRLTAGADKAYDTSDDVATLRAIDVYMHAGAEPEPSPGQLASRCSSAIDGRTPRHAGYGLSQQRRRAIECIFGWGKRHGTLRKTKHREALAWSGT